MPKLTFQPTFGFPTVFNPLETGLAIEDMWPSMYVGAESVPEIRRKAESLGWAKSAVERWRAEAEGVLAERPEFSRDESAGRSAMFTNQGHYLQFDVKSREHMWDPWSNQNVDSHERASLAWVTLQHERIRRLMSSLAILWSLTDDERYSRWVWDGLRESAALYEELGPPNADKHRYLYGGLYESQSVLQLLQAVEIVKRAPGGSAADLRRIQESIFIPVGEALSRWMDVMMVHNMSVWSMSALTILGRDLGREEWIDKAMSSERCGVRMLLENGVRRHAETGQPDGFWFEHSPFYGCFYVMTSLIPVIREAQKREVMDDALLSHYVSMFDAPAHLVDAELRLLSISDRVGPGYMRLEQMIPQYEYAAGQLDERFGGMLSLLYQRMGSPRASLAAMAYGPDELPNAERPASLTKSCCLPEAQLVTFRSGEEHGNCTLWFNALKRYPRSAQGHHHMDKLSVSLHGYGQIITSDIGWPGLETDKSRAQFLNGTFSHNTLMLNEHDQPPCESVEFAHDVEATVPWARASVRGLSEDRLYETFENHHGGRLKAGLYDDAVLTRTVFADFPRIVLRDDLDAETEKRFGFVFHSRGWMVTQCIPAEEQEALDLTSLPSDGAWSCFQGREHQDPISMFVADWRIDTHVYLRLVTCCDVPFDASWGHTPDNPAEVRRGTVVLRSTGKRRTFASVLEIHHGSPTVSGIEIGAAGAVKVLGYDGNAWDYA